jgi:hypothetical protein
MKAAVNALVRSISTSWCFLWQVLDHANINHRPVFIQDGNVFSIVIGFVAVLEDCIVEFDHFLIHAVEHNFTIHRDFPLNRGGD